MNIIVKPMVSDNEKKGKAYVHWKSWHEAYEKLVSKSYLDKLTRQKCEEWAFEWPENTYVAIDNGNVIGFMCCFGHGEEEPDACEINAIYVLSEYYGTGVAQKLMDTALEELKKYSRKELWVLKDNPRAIAFYKKYGFHEDGTEKYLKSLEDTEIRMIME